MFCVASCLHFLSAGFNEGVCVCVCATHAYQCAQLCVCVYILLVLMVAETSSLHARAGPIVDEAFSACTFFLLFFKVQNDQLTGGTTFS